MLPARHGGPPAPALRAGAPSFVGGFCGRPAPGPVPVPGFCRGPPRACGPCGGPLRARGPSGRAALPSGPLRCAAGPSSRSARPLAARSPGPPPCRALWSGARGGGCAAFFWCRCAAVPPAGPASVPSLRSAGPPRAARRGPSGAGALSLASLGRRRRRALAGPWAAFAAAGRGPRFSPVLRRCAVR